MGMGIEMPSPRQPCSSVTFGLFRSLCTDIYLVIAWLTAKETEIFPMNSDLSPTRQL